MTEKTPQGSIRYRRRAMTALAALSDVCTSPGATSNPSRRSRATSAAAIHPFHGIGACRLTSARAATNSASATAIRRPTSVAIAAP